MQTSTTSSRTLRHLGRGLLLGAGLALCASGCSWTHAKIPNAGIPFADAKYSMDGATTEKVCANYILYINWAKLFGIDTASRSSGGSTGGVLAALGGLFSGPVTEEKRALYNALEKMGDATHLLAPRVKTTFNGWGTIKWPFLGERCAEVTGHAVTMKGMK